MILFAACRRVQWCATVLLYQQNSFHKSRAGCRLTFIKDEQRQLRHFHEAMAKGIRKDRVRRYNDSEAIQNSVPDGLIGP